MRRLLQKIAFVLVGALALASCGSEPPSKGTPIEMRRLSEEQYRNIISDVFGSTISVAGRFDPVTRREGLLAVGARNIGITPAGFERFEGLARSIAAQVVDERNRKILIGCEAGDACAAAFYKKVGRLLFRRALSDEEVAGYVTLAREAAKMRGDFHAGLGFGLAGMLTAPEFLYIIEFAEPDPDNDGAQRRDAYSKATRLSFLLWNTTPDDALLIAAEKGALHTRKGLNEQIDRMMAAPKFEQGVRAFFSDMLAFDSFDTLSKDGIIYPAFSSSVTADAKEQTLRTIVDLLVHQNSDYRDLFTTRQTFMTPALGPLYKVAVARDGAWSAFEFPEDSDRLGIQTQLAFVALHSHPGKSSPTLRGKAIREHLLCQKVPDPPADVSFDLFHTDGVKKTARQKLDAHNSVPACAGCHKIMDPIGLTLEKFDGAGQGRLTDSGESIDTSGELDGVPFDGARGLAVALRDNPALPACLVDRLYTYAVGRRPAISDRKLMKYLEKAFADGDYKFAPFMRRIATSDAFFAVAKTGTVVANVK